MNKYKHRWSILCQKGIIDRNDNNLSLISVLEVLTFNIPKDSDKSLEFVFPIAIDVVSLWDNDMEKEGELDFILEGFSPDKKKILEIVPKFDIDKSKERLRTIITVNGLKALPIDGVYTFFIKERNGNGYKKVCEIPLKVKIDEV